jgi:hypothetical protein
MDIFCPAGKVALSGGYAFYAAGADNLSQMYPEANYNNGDYGYHFSWAGFTTPLELSITCADAG